MANPNALIADAAGLQTQPNELTLPAGSLSVCENMEITRDGVIEVSRGFQDFSDNLPDVKPDQILVVGGTAYAHVDGGLWYYDATSDEWLRKEGTVGAKLATPQYTYVSGGYLFVSSSTNEKVVYKINLSTGARTILAGRFSVGGSADGTGDAARFDTTMGMYSDGTYLYVGDKISDSGFGQTIRKINIATGAVTTIAGAAGSTGSTDGTGTAARFSSPSAMTSDGTSLYILQSANGNIRKLVLSTAVVTTIVSGTGALYGLVYVDGYLYFTDVSARKIKKCDVATGTVTDVAGSGVSGTDDGSSSAATFTSPYALATDGTYLWAFEKNVSIIRRITIATGDVLTVVSAAAGLGDNIYGMFYADGAIWCADYDNALIRKIYVNTYYVTTIAGASGVLAVAANALWADGIIAGPAS